MGAGSALFDPADVQVSRSELDLIPAQVHEFGSTQAVAVGHEDHGGVAVAPAVSRWRLSSAARPRPRSGTRGCAGRHWGGRLGLTVRFTVAGETSLRCRLAMEIGLVGIKLFE